MEINPSQMASQMASIYMQSAEQQLAAQNKTSKARSDGLSQLQKALQDFRSSLATLAGKKSMLAMSASLSRDGIATASAGATAQAGSYSLFVDKVASAHQLAFGNIGGVPAAEGGSFSVTLQGGATFNVSLASADVDGDLSLSASEIARAINQAADNQGKVNAMVLTADGQSRLVLSSAATGAAGQISLDTSGIGNAALKATLDAPTQLSAAQDAEVWLGEKGTGVLVKQASNTFTAIQGVTLTLSRAMSPGDAQLQLTVARNDGDTAANLQSFVDSYNTLLKSLGTLTSSGDGKTAAGIFATDSGVRTLRDQLNNMVRQNIGGVRLAEMGVSASRDGSLTLDRSKLTRLLQDKPAALDSFFSDSNGDGLIKSVRGYLDQWLSSTKGVITQRRDSITRTQDDLDKRQIRLEAEYQQVYQRYLGQYSRLQAMQSQMSSTLDSLNNYFAQNQ